MVRQTLSAMEAQLEPTKFLRIHPSAIVNIAQIQELQPMFGQQHVVVMEDGTRLTILKYRDKVVELLGEPALNLYF